MKIAEREQQILRVKAASFQPELDEALEQALRVSVLEAVKGVLEGALDEEVKAELAKLTEDKPRRSGYFQRGLDTQYGHVSDLRVPKLRRRNGEREWQILQRYQRGLGNLLNWLCCRHWFRCMGGKKACSAKDARICSEAKMTGFRGSNG